MLLKGVEEIFQPASPSHAPPLIRQDTTDKRGKAKKHTERRHRTYVRERKNESLMLTVQEISQLASPGHALPKTLTANIGKMKKKKLDFKACRRFEGRAAAYTTERAPANISKEKEEKRCS